WIAASQFLPTFLLGFWGGTLADRWPKRSLLFATQACLLLLTFALIQLALVDTTNLWAYLTVTTGIGFVLAVDFPTRLAFVMELVGREDLTNAVGLNSLLFNAARLVGPLLAGIVMAWGGPVACFWVNSVSFLAVLFALMQMDMATAFIRADGRGPQRPGSAPERQHLLAGFFYLAARP